MRPVKPRRSAGFTLIEAGVVLAIMGILVAVAVPGMQDWVLGRKAMSAAGFYKDGLALARSQAVAHNSASRLVLVDNANGQMDWRIDLCWPTASAPCNADNGSWSTASTPADGDPDKSAGFRSITRSAATMPDSKQLATGTAPVEADTAYFTPLGWVDGKVNPRLTRITLAPALTRSGAFAPVAVALTLAGNAAICNPGAAAHSARACPPGTGP